jgi:hypothetical protein
MGLFGGGFEKTEARGEAALARGEALQAFRLFRDAHRQAERRAPEATARLSQKMNAARVAFARLKIAEARQLLGHEAAAAALEALAIAQDYVEQGEAELAGEVGELKARAETLRRGPAEAPAPEEPPAPTADSALAAEASPDMPGLESELLELDDADADPETLFEQLAGALTPEDAERAAALGPAFRAGFVAAQRGDTPEALRAFTEAAGEHPDDPLVLEHLALAHDHSDRPGEAAELYRRALDRAPTRWNSRVALAGILAGSSAAGGKAEHAIALLDEGLTADPAQGASYLLAAAEILIALRRPLDALPRITRAMQAGAEHAVSAWQLYGGALEGAGMLEEAEQAFERAVRLGGHAMQPRAQFAEFALRTGRALEAAGEMIFETCVGCQATPPSPEELDYYGFLLTRIQFARGQHKAALEGAERLLAKTPAPAVREVLLEVRRQAREALARRAAAPEEEPA